MEKNYVWLFWLALLVFCFAIVWGAIAGEATHPPANRLCFCKSYGPHGGCLRWTCRTHRAPEGTQ
jgi:hypothetical protein